MKDKGMVLVYTGDGKGKTTAALGLAIRSLGHGKRVCIIQFIKSPAIKTGEKVFFEKLGIEMYQKGIGFTNSKTPEEHRKALSEAWLLAKSKINSEEYDLVILDEINNALDIQRFPIKDILPIEEVVEILGNRPQRTHIVLTGRNAQKEIIEVADLVTVMKEEKHYYDRGIDAILGIEY